MVAHAATNGSGRSTSSGRRDGGEARNDRELAVELRMLKKKVRKLEDQALPIPICKYFLAFVGMVIALVVMLKMYGKA